MAGEMTQYVLLALILLSVMALVALTMVSNKKRDEHRRRPRRVVMEKEIHLLPTFHTHEFDPHGFPHKHHNMGGLVGGCSGTQYGCCSDGVTAKVDQRGSNCLLY